VQQEAYGYDMRAIVLDRPGAPDERELTLRTVPDPIAGRGELLVRIAACGVCRTDLQIVSGDLPPHRLPLVPGHQVVGRVAAVGPEVEGWNVGDRVGVAWLAGVDGTCRECLAGHENLCLEATFTGWDRDGGFAELTTVRADMALRMPEGFADLDAAPLLCGGVIGYRSLLVSGIQPGGRLGLFGFGASALLAIQVARHWDCEVFVWTRSEREQQRARDLGAAWVGGYDDVAPGPLDAAVTFAPVGDIVVRALRAVDRGGTVAINAIHLDRVPEFPYQLLWWERSLRSVANFTRADAAAFLELAATIPVRTATELHPLEEGTLALERLAAGQVEGAAVLRMADLD
jgi:propanol-preferring alcohol dehydrogenase